MPQPSNGPTYITDVSQLPGGGGVAPVAPAAAAPAPTAATAGPKYVSDITGLLPQDAADQSPVEKAQNNDPYLDAASGDVNPASIGDQFKQWKQFGAGAGSSALTTAQAATRLLGDAAWGTAKALDTVGARLNIPSNLEGQVNHFVQSAQNDLANGQADLSKHGANSPIGQVGQISGDIAGAGLGGAGLEAGTGLALGARGLGAIAPKLAAVPKYLLVGNRYGKAALQGTAATEEANGANSGSWGELAAGAAANTLFGAGLHLTSAVTANSPIKTWVEKKLAGDPNAMDAAGNYILNLLKQGGSTVEDLDKSTAALGKQATIADHPSLLPTAVNLAKVQGEPHDMLSIPHAARLASLHTDDVPDMVRSAMGVPDTDHTDLLKLQGQTEYLNHGNSGATGSVYKPGLYEKAGAQTVDMPSDVLQQHVDEGDRYGVIQHLQDIAKNARQQDINNGVAKPDDFYSIMKPPPAPVATQVPLTDEERMALAQKQAGAGTPATKPITKAANVPSGPLDAAAVAQMLGKPAEAPAALDPDELGVPTHKTVMVQPTYKPELKDSVPMQWLMDLKGYVKNTGADAWENGDASRAKALVGSQKTQDAGILQNLNDHMREQSPEFAQANDNDTAYAKAEAAFNQGMKHQTMSPGEIDGYMNGTKVNGKIVKPGLDADGKRWFMTGAAQKLVSDMHKTALRPDGMGGFIPSTNSVQRAFGSITKHESTQALFKNHAQGAALMNKLNNAATLMDNSRRLVPNATELAEGPPNSLPHLVGAASRIAASGGHHVLHPVLHALSNITAEHNAYIPPELQSKIAGIMAMPRKDAVAQLMALRDRQVGVVRKVLRGVPAVAGQAVTRGPAAVYGGLPMGQLGQQQQGQ